MAVYMREDCAFLILLLSRKRRNNVGNVGNVAQTEKSHRIPSRKFMERATQPTSPTSVSEAGLDAVPLKAIGRTVLVDALQLLECSFEGGSGLRLTSCS